MNAILRSMVSENAPFLKPSWERGYAIEWSSQDWLLHCPKNAQVIGWFAEWRQNYDASLAIFILQIAKHRKITESKSWLSNKWI